MPPDAINGSDNRYLSGGLESMCPASELPPEPNDQPTGGYIHQDGWWALGTRADWYLAPTPQGGFDFTKALFDLTGAPAVPPLFGMGFMCGNCLAVSDRFSRAFAPRVATPRAG